MGNTDGSSASAWRRQMEAITSPCWWTRPICWSGIRNEIERQAIDAEHAGKIDQAREFARIARIAGERC